MTRFALLAALAALLLAPAAAAGGGWWSVIQVTGAPVAAGERVELKASLLFSSSAVAEAAQQPGRYRVHLLRGFDDSGVERAMRKASPGDWWSPGAAEAIEVGPVTVRATEANFGEATAAFRVPELAAGSYHVMLCDTGCANPLADVIPTAGFTVVADPATAQLAKRVARLERRSRSQARRLAASREEPSAQPTTAPPPPTRGADAAWLIAAALAGALVVLVLRRRASIRHQADDPGSRRREDVQGRAALGARHASVLDVRRDDEAFAGTHDARLSSDRERELA